MRFLLNLRRSITLKKYSVVITDDAKQDLADIYNYISIDLSSPVYAANQLTRIKESIISLGEFPKRYKTLELEIDGKKDIRRMPVDNYNVLYKIDNNRVVVLYILYSASDINHRLKSKK